MNKELILLNYRMVQVPIVLSFVGFTLLICIGAKALLYALVAGLLCLIYAVDQMMGKSVVGDKSVMMNLLPVSARNTVMIKGGICGVWVGVICSIPAFLMLRNGGTYIDAEVSGLGDSLNTGGSIFYRGLPWYRYAVDTNPSALDVAVGDLMDGGAGVLQIGLMSILVPIILFFIGCYFGLAVLITQLYLHPLMKKAPTMVVSVIGMALGGIAALGAAFLIKGAIEQGFLSLFAGEMLTAVFFGGMTWFLANASMKKLDHGYDV